MMTFSRGLIFLSAFVLSFTMGFGLGFKNAEYRNDNAEWQSVMPPEPPDVCSLMDEHLSTAGNWVGIETQVNEDCGLRFIIELGTGTIEGFEFGDVFQDGTDGGPEPTPAPCPFNIDPNLSIDPDEVY